MSITISCVESNKASQLGFIEAQAKVLWTLDHLTIEEMIESGWLIMTIDVDIENCTLDEVASLLEARKIYFQ